MWEWSVLVAVTTCCLCEGCCPASPDSLVRSVAFALLRLSRVSQHQQVQEMYLSFILEAFIDASVS
jgi:hypothetical protein